MKLIYAERFGDREAGEEYIAERGVFMSIEEFARYRRMGWEGTLENNALADAIIKQENASNMEHDALEAWGTERLADKVREMASLLLECRDALPAITFASAKLHGINLSLADRIEQSLKEWETRA